MQVVQTLRDAGHQALLAGGCVRDLLLARKPGDYDVATSATPEQVQDLFRRTLSIGAQFGVIVVLLGTEQVEVATFRSEQAYADGRRPGEVVFTDPREDALRRDFTINGMFYDPIEQHVIDYVGGRHDLAAGIVRAIGDPRARFQEDHLRMLRAIRFASRLGFAIDPATWQAIQTRAGSIRRISPERVAMELEMILTDPNRSRGLELAWDSGLLGIIFERLSDAQLDRGLAVVSKLPREAAFALVLAALFVDDGETPAEETCRDLRLSNDLRKRVHWLVHRRKPLLDAIPLSRGRLKLWLAAEGFQELVMLCRASLAAAGTSDEPLQVLARQIEELGDEPIQPPRLLDGNELMQLGARPGPLLGLLAADLYLAQLENDVQSKEQAQAWVRQWLAHKGHSHGKGD